MRTKSCHCYPLLFSSQVQASSISLIKIRMFKWPFFLSLKSWQTPASISLFFLTMTHTNLVVHEGFQALNKFVLVPFINTLLPENSRRTNLITTQSGTQKKWKIFHVNTHCFLSSSFSRASRRRPRPSWPKLLTQLYKDTYKHED